MLNKKLKALYRSIPLFKYYVLYQEFVITDGL